MVSASGRAMLAGWATNPSLPAARARAFGGVLALLFLFTACSPAAPAAGLHVERLELPPGFHVEVFSDAVPGARSLAAGGGGIVYVGTRGEGKVYALVDADGDGRAERVKTIASGLDMPNGVAWRDGALYVAEVSRILRFDGLDRRLDDPPPPQVVSDRFPSDHGHGWKFIAFGPDGDLYVPVGVPCNVCEPRDPVYGTITRMRPDGSGFEIYARGIRNSVGFDWNPASGVLWFTDNGRDWLGDDRPPDELDRAPHAGMNFGFPYCHGGDIPDPDLGGKHPCSDFEPPARKLGPHVASLGMRFYTGKMFPAEYRGQIFIAEHGSWNRTRPIGYRVTMVRLEGGRAVSYEPFATGWLADGKAWGRPVDLLVRPDGSLLVSDDRAGAVYRITYSPPAG